MTVRRIGRFCITSTLGEGGMGLVYAATDEDLQRRVAIKVIRRELTGDPLARERFRREARVVADLADPHICRIYDVGEANDQLYMVMELLEGESLAARLQRGPVPLAESVQIVLEVLSALDALHRHGVVHRDLKPSNLFLTPSGAKLVDFGLAYEVPGPADETRVPLTASGLMFGTPRYMAPEQLLGRAADPRTDLFAAGAMFYELLSGRPAYDADSILGAVSRLADPEPPSLGGSTGIDAANRVIQRAMAFAAEVRYPSAAAMQDDVRALLVYCREDDAHVLPEVRAPARSVAVLPFVEIGSGADDEFADGMTEDVIARVSKLRALKVIARRSVLPFKRREQSYREIGRQLGVRTLLDGSVRRTGTRARVVVELVDAATEEQLWSETYDRELSDLFTVQADVAQQIARSLEAELTSGERARLRKTPAESLEARHLYLKGRHCLMRYTSDGLAQAVGFLEHAVSLEPGFALGHAWIALAHIISGMGYSGGDARPDRTYTLARTAAERALACDPDLGEAHGALAFVKLVMEFDWEGADRGFRIALELSPNSDLMWSAYGLLLSATGRYDDAVAAYRRAQRLDPLTPVHSSTLASMLLRAGHVNAAIEEARRLIELQPDFPMAHSTLGWALLKRGDAAGGLAALERSASLAPGNTMLLGQLASACGAAGRIEEARHLLGQLQTVAQTRHVSPYHFAYVHAGLGDDEAAMDHLERALDERAGGIYNVKGSFVFTRLASHPRFRALLRRMNLDRPERQPGHAHSEGRHDAH